MRKNIRHISITCLLGFAAITVGYCQNTQSEKNNFNLDKIVELIDSAKTLQYTDLNNAVSVIEKAEKIIQKNPVDSIVGYLYFRKASIYYFLGYIDSSIVLLKEAIRFYQKSPRPNLEKIADAYTNLGIYYNDIAYYDSAYYAFQKAASLYEKVHIPQYVADSWNNIGTLFLYWGKTDSAIFYFKKALQFYNKKPQYQEYKTDVLTNLSNVYSILG
ncbi:MAG: tetratricopeptide repeat protein, partial [Bacteroidetes bacterium]